MMRKLITILLVAALLLGAVLPVSASFTDVEEDSKYSEAVEVLVAVGLLKGYEDNTFRPDNTITRAEFATIITRMLGLENVVGGASASSIFTDMLVGTAEHWASGYIKIAYDQGVIHGMGDGTFAPDNPVTYEQAVKMMVCSLGYELAAVELGGWPDGYLAQAEELGMLKGIEMEKTDMSASRALVAQMLFNSLEVKLAEKTSAESIAVTEKTVLKNKLGYAYFNNYMISQVDGTDSISDGEIRLLPGEIAFAQSKDPFVYTDVLEKLEAKSMLGSYVRGYYKIGSEDEAHRLIYLDESKNKSTETIILSENIDAYRDFELKYYPSPDSDKTEEITISTNAQLLYNGSLYDFASGSVAERDLSKWLDPNSEDFIDGQVRLLENTGDKKIDTIFIEDYEIYIAKSGVLTTDSIAANNFVIYDNYVSGKNIRIDPYAPRVTAEFYNALTGAEMEIEDIKAMHVVSVAANMSETKFKVYISNKTVKGKIEEFAANGEYVIGNETYATTAGYEALVAAGTIQPKIGAEGTFYLDHNNRICAAKITQEDAGVYAYVTNAGIDNERAILKLINLSGSPSKPTKVKCAQTVKVNGKATSEPQDILDVLENTADLIDANADADNARYAQLIRYVKNASGQISKITTISTRNNEIVVTKNEDTDILVTGVEKQQFTYNTASGFNSKVFINSSTLVLVAPDDRGEDAGYKRTTAMSYFKSGKRYNIEAYDLNASAVAKVVVVYNATTVSAETAVDYTTPVNIITKVNTGLSKLVEDELVYHIEVYQNGAIKTYETENMDAVYATIKVGDIIRFGFNADGQINKLGRSTETHELNLDALVPEFKYDVYNGTTNPIMYNTGEYYFKTVYGTVSTVTDESIFIAPTLVDTTGEEPTLDITNAVGFRLNSSVKMYHVRITDSSTNVNVLSNLNTVIEYGELKNANATTMFAQAYAGTLKMLVLVVDERTAP